MQMDLETHVFDHFYRVPPEKDFFRRNGFEYINIDPAYDHKDMCVCRDHTSHTLECGPVNEQKRGMILSTQTKEL